MSDVAYVYELGECDVCKMAAGDTTRTAVYDARLLNGQWARVCQEHFDTMTNHKLGTGEGQRLVVGEKPKATGRITEDMTWDEMEDLVGDGDPIDFL